MKILNKYKQYGFLNFTKFSFLAILRPLFKVNKTFVLCIPGHKRSVVDASVKLMSAEKINTWRSLEKITLTEANRFLNFLNFDCLGYYIEVENELAAWGFVQQSGDYQFGEYIYRIPNHVHLLKNLYVKPEFRGLSLGKKINLARINNVPNEYVPCVFVIPENRYAVRNLKMFGFQDTLLVSKTKWLRKFTKTKIKTYNNDEITNVIINGFTLD